MDLFLNEKQDALRLRCHETGKIHVSWVVRGEDLPFPINKAAKNQLFFIIFEDIPENYPATGLIIEPFALERVEDIYTNIYEGWGCGDQKLPSPDSLYGKAFMGMRNGECAASTLPGLQRFSSQRDVLRGGECTKDGAA
jgi:hypothetical protein